MSLNIHINIHIIYTHIYICMYTKPLKVSEA